jgi:integrase/recombinase XerD
MEITNNILKFEKELRFKRYRENSIDNYVSYVKVFLQYFKDKVDPKHINESDIKTFLSQFSEHNTQRSYHSSIKAFYKYVAHQPNKFRYIEYCKRNRRLPIVLSVIEMEQLINACTNLKHKTIICLMYSCALRVGEVINLKLKDLDYSRGIINIKDAKGGKDRQVMLAPELQDLLDSYIINYKPIDYLFSGQFEPFYSERSISNFLKKYAELAGLEKRVYPHLLRHTSATHFVEQGTDINLLQKLLGHSNVKTTHLYTHISNNFISRMPSPLSQINFNKSLELI